MPASAFLKSIDPQMRMDQSSVEYTEEVAGKMARFDDLMQNPADHGEDGIETIMDLHESFHLLQPMGEKWGKWVMFKCTCLDFFGAAICAHSMLLAFLYDDTLQFDGKNSSKQLPEHKGKSKKPSAWAEVHEEEDETPRAQRWAPQQLGAQPLVIPARDQPRPVKVCSVLTISIHPICA